MREWHFQLVGDQLDTDAIAELFRDKLRIEKDENGSTQLVMDLRFTNHESQLSVSAGERGD